MNYRTLLQLAGHSFDHRPIALGRPFTPQLFARGARWMQQQLQALDPATSPAVDPGIPFTAWGLLKYGSCSVIAGAAGYGLWLLHPALTPLAVLVFYSCEIHFLFLFPLLLDGRPDPLRASIRSTYKVGPLRALLTVLPIAGYMLLGLLRLRQPLRQWHIGCLAILIWYQDEIRNRF
ncbi:hypothetical protein [Flaviaesturariibacter amylovorans]|uniref:Uncharacterized protein n=1 Tax=Flaviaesturariibacter amylovorans TaxID=1084520 RepID=A0ABP8G4I2_9BACT